MKKLIIMMAFIGTMTMFINLAFGANTALRPSVTVYPSVAVYQPKAIYTAELLAFGDSITKGIALYPYDPYDTTGYPDELQKELSSPTTLVRVYTEAEPGKASFWGRTNIETILNKPEYDRVSYVLIQFGTNDATKNVSEMDFKENMEDIIDAVLDKGKTPLLAKPPMIYGTCPDISRCNAFNNPWTETDNHNIFKYNVIIDTLVEEYQLKNARGEDFIPPNFLSIFQKYYNYETHRPENFSDNFHPDLDGFKRMAEEWRIRITGESYRSIY